MTNSDERLRAENAAIRDVLARGAERRLRAIPGVVHVSVGVKEKDGGVTRQLCIRVYVRQKRGRAEIAASEIVPNEIEGVPTDVNMVAGSVAFQTDNTRYRPIIGGAQITNRILVADPSNTGTQMVRGTLGCAAIDNEDKAEVILSNSHILMANGGAKGDKIYQPAPVWLPAITPAQLPFKPTDDNDKIAIVRRGVMSTKVDAAIAAIDVSSCCHCCGIHYSNAVRGLSEGGTPPKNTIVGDAAAQANETVFKVGQGTLRTAGVVVDPNYPDFQITEGPATHTFSGQIAIRHTDATKTFSAQGDSGAVVINGANKIVGLLFAAGRDVSGHPFLSLANHISDVFSELKIKIPYASDVKVTSGQRIPDEYRALRSRLSQHENTSRLLALGERHADEVTQLVNHCKPVTIAWHKNQGPALLATIMGAIRDGHDTIPEAVKGVPVHAAVETMRGVLHRYGSEALQAHVGRPETAPLIERLKHCRNIDELIERIARDETLTAVLRGIS
jgi:hypothetical protein